MTRIENITTNEGINKITFEAITEGSEVENIFARYKKVTFYNDGSSKDEFIRAMPSEQKMGMFGFYYAGNKAGLFTYKFDGIIREEKATPKSEYSF